MNSSSVFHTSPYPTIEDGRSSFVAGKYIVSLKRKGDSTAMLTHKIKGSPFFNRLIENGQAKFGCLLCAAKTGYKKLELSNTQQQKINWQLSITGEAPKLHPILLYTGEHNKKYTLNESDGVIEIWHGKEFSMPKGARLARTNFFVVSSSAAAKLYVLQNTKPSIKYNTFNDADYTALRKKLIKEKGSDFQKEFLEAVKDSNAYLAKIDEAVGATSEGKDFTKLTDNLTEFEYKEPTKEVEKELYEKWADVEPAQACQAIFWGKVTLEHIRAGKIESYFLAANGGSLPGGLERIDEALHANDPKKIDAVVRTVIRRMSGLQEARGNRSVYVDCPFSRAWWREHIARQICTDAPNAEPANIIKILRNKYWEDLISLIVSKNSVLGDNKVRTALVWALSENNKTFTAKELREKIVKAIGVRLAWQELAVYEIDELKKIIDSIIGD